MPDNVQVLEDEERVGSDQPKRRWMAVAAAFAVGAVAGAVFFGPTVVPVPPDPTGPTLPTVVRPTVTTPDPGLAEVVEGFDDALVAVVRQNAGIDYLIWPVARGPALRAIPANDGNAVTIDPTGVWVATLTDVPGAPGGLLSLGRSTGIRPVTSGVDSYVWHDTASGIIGFLRHEEGSWGLYEASVFPVPIEKFDLGPDYPGELVAYGAWGFALQRPGEFVVVSEPPGEGSRPGETRDWSAVGARVTIDGLLLDSWDGSFLVYAGEQVQLVEPDVVIPILRRGGVVGGSFSPDGSKMAIVQEDEVTVMHRIGGLHSSYPFSPRTGRISWAGERFLVAPASPRGVRIVDLVRRDMSGHLTDYTVFWAGTIPLGDS